ncbi:MAG: hypothetical protein WB952_08610 [Terriglobales bacterium]
MKPVRFLLLLLVGFACLPIATMAQEPPLQLAGTPVPRLVSFSGRISGVQGKTVTGMTGITFAIYKDQYPGAPLWMETQNVQVDSKGNYTVQLGATKSDGLPLELFTSGEARWIGVQVQDQEEQPRILLLSVPYALKAGDAQTVGGLPASAFVLAAPPATASAAPVSSDSAASAPPPSSSVTGTGSAGLLPLWDSASDIITSALSQSGSGSSAKIGINTTTPSTTLDVKGSATIRGILALPANGTAKASGGKNSEPMTLTASAFNSDSGTAVKQNFQWLAEPVGNNSSTESGSLNLLFGQGSNKAAETGLQISSAGLFTFAPGQTFPGVGTISGVTAGKDLVGGGSTGNVTITLDLSRVPELGAPNVFTASQTVTGNVNATGLVSGSQLVSTVPSGTPPLNVSSATQVPNLNASLLAGLASNSFAQLSLSNAFFATQGILTHSGLMVMGDMQCNTGFLGISFGSPSSCSNYSLLGEGTNTFINRRTGGTIFFRENNANQMTIASQGVVAMTSTLDKGTGLTLSSSQGDGAKITAGTDSTKTGRVGLTVNGGTDTRTTSSSTGGTAVVATGGISTFGSSPFGGTGGDGIQAFGADMTTSGSLGGTGIFAMGGDGKAFYGEAIEAFAGNGPGTPHQSALFGNDVGIEGNLQVDGTITGAAKTSRIDHPLDPSNKYLNHSSVESSEMVNIYSGNVKLDAAGSAVVELPTWFQAANADFRYQLTAIGSAAPSLHVAEEISNNQFRIAGGIPGMKVSWQVTGVRQDAYAKAHPLVVEEDKPANLRGYYLHPELFGQPEEKQTDWARRPAVMKYVKEKRMRYQAMPTQAAATDLR